MASSSLPFSPLSSPVKKTNNNHDGTSPTTNLSGFKINPTRPVPVSAITYDVVTRVVDSWEQAVKSSRNWETVVGKALAFQMMENDPEAKKLFGVSTAHTSAPESSSFHKEDFYKLSMEKQLDFIAKSRNIIVAIDAAVCTLGPDLSLLQRQCHEMGDDMSSWTSKCQPQQWALAGEALLQVLQSRLGEERFTDEHRKSWIMIYNFASYHIVTRSLQKQPPSLVSPTSVVAPCPNEIESQASKLVERRKRASTTADTLNKAETTKLVSLDCTKPVLLDVITFDMVSRVLSSWERGIKDIPNWSSTLGVAFMRYIFKHTGAEGKRLMGYPANVEWDDPALATDPAFRKKGMRLIEAIDMALGFLGPDLSPLEKTMVDLGRRHYYMDCQPKHWPLVGEALFDVFRESMGKDGTYFTQDVEEAWTVIYNFLGYHMIAGLNAEKEAVLARSSAK